MEGTIRRRTSHVTQCPVRKNPRNWMLRYAKTGKPGVNAHPHVMGYKLESGIVTTVHMSQMSCKPVHATPDPALQPTQLQPHQQQQPLHQQQPRQKHHQKGANRGHLGLPVHGRVVLATRNATERVMERERKSMNPDCATQAPVQPPQYLHLTTLL